MKLGVELPVVPPHVPVPDQQVGHLAAAGVDAQAAEVPDAAVGGVHMIAAGSSSRCRRCACLPTKSSSFTRGAVMPASTTVYSVSSSLPCAR